MAKYSHVGCTAFQSGVEWLGLRSGRFMLGIFDKLYGRKKQINEEESVSEEKYKELKEIDNWIETLDYIPNDDREELTAGLIRSLGPDERKLACICLIFQRDYFKTELNESIKIKVRFLITETPHNRLMTASYVKIFDSENPGIDEYFHFRDTHLRRLVEQDYTYLIIAEPKYKIYFIRKINFDKTLRDDLNKIKKAFERYGEESGSTTLGEDPSLLNAMLWYQNNVNMNKIDRKYF